MKRTLLTLAIASIFTLVGCDANFFDDGVQEAESINSSEQYGEPDSTSMNAPDSSSPCVYLGRYEENKLQHRL